MLHPKNLIIFVHKIMGTEIIVFCKKIRALGNILADGLRRGCRDIPDVY